MSAFLYVQAMWPNTERHCDFMVEPGGCSVMQWTSPFLTVMSPNTEDLPVAVGTTGPVHQFAADQLCPVS